MKNILSLTIFFIVFYSIFFPIKAQNPYYEARLVNGNITAPNTLEFDIYVKRIGAIPFEVYGLQCALIFNDSIRNGGTLTVIYIPGTSEMLPSQVPNDPNITSVVLGKRVFKLAPRIPTGPGFGTIISNTGNGTRLGRFRISTSASSFTIFYPDINWNFDQATYGYATKFNAYVGGFPLDITVQQSHLNYIGGICFSCIQDYKAWLINDIQVNANTYEFDIYFKNAAPWNSFIVNGLQICLLLNDSISNGGILNTSYIAGTSEMSPVQIPDDPDVLSIIGGKRVWKLAAKKTDILSSTSLSISGFGTRLGRFRITTSAPSFANAKLNISWNFDLTYGYKTIIETFWYSPPNFPYVITSPSHHLNDLFNLPLPVELISFGASAIVDKKVLLEWSTASELNNKGFEIQRKLLSAQLQVNNNEYESIGFVEGKGTSNQTSNYVFNDMVEEIGNYSYRLKQIDFDGSCTYSNEVHVNVTELTTEYVLSQNYPNPVNPTTTIEYVIPQAGYVSLALYNLLGEKVSEIVNDFKKSGIYMIDFDASNLSSGTYIYILRANGNTNAKKMIVAK